ncbi:MAG: ATP-binding protein [Pirellulales bacterium]|nr:ATP-binding protein [Pirellulales bacterium]
MKQASFHTAQLEETNERIETKAAARAKELESAQMQLLHSEKLAAVGGLAAGIAHEINTPTQFVGDNVRACRDMFGDLERMIGAYQSSLANLRSVGTTIPDDEQLTSLEAEVDLDYIFEDAPQAFEQTLEGVDRIRSIVSAMKNFSHGGSADQKTTLNINEAITNTLTVARNEIKYVADVRLELGEIPDFEGYLSELNQVFLNLFVNAAHAISDANPERGAIFVQTGFANEEIEISVTDTGCGIPEDVQSRIFEPFFTTKEVGRGSGQGLAIAYQIVTERHGGSITFETAAGRGTTFVIKLPSRPASENVLVAAEANSA